MNSQSPSKLGENPDYYMYDDFPDYHFNNSSESQHKDLDTNLPSTVETSQIQTGPIAFFKPSTTMLPAHNSLNKKKNPTIPPSPGSSGFTFFGVPLPNLNFNLWGNTGKKSQRKDGPISRPGRSRYRTYPPSEPEIQNGGFRPLPEPQGGFTPIIDPRLTHDRKLKNESSPVMNRTATITRVYTTSRRKGSKNSTADALKRRQKEDEIITEKTDTSALSSATDIHRVPLNVTLKMSNFTTKNDSMNDNDLKDSGNGTKMSENTQLDVDSEETVLLEGKIASKIVWTTPGSTVKVENLTFASPMEVGYKTRGKNTFWDTEEDEEEDEEEEQATLPKPSGTSPMSIDTSHEPVIFVTTDNSGESTRDAETNANERISSSQTARALEASALSALLIPGGQIPASIPLRVNHPSGRSSIEKVPSPHLSTNNSSRAGNINLTSNEMIEKSEIEGDTEIGTKATVKVVYEDDPFNWYFQNYNESNLEPYVGIIYNRNNDVKNIPYFSIVLIAQIYLIL